MTAPRKPLPTPGEVLGYAVTAAYDAAAAATPESAFASAREGQLWLGIARELREGATQPLIDRAMDRLTLHDIEGVVCSHGRVALRRKNSSPSLWFVHTDDGSNCAEPMAETEHFRRRAVNASCGLGCSLHGGVADDKGWIDCGLAVCGHEPQDVKRPVPAEPETYGTTLAGTPTYGAVTEAAARTEVIEVINPQSGRIADYWKGQIPPPSELAIRYAEELRRAVNAGESIPGTEGWDADTWSGMSALVGEILTRAEQDAVSAPIARPYVDTP